MFISESIVGSVITENNSYLLDNKTVSKREYYRESEICFYYTLSNFIGEMEITNFDKISYLISGNFYFRGYSEDCSDLVEITNGRFDLKYIP